MNLERNRNSLTNPDKQEESRFDSLVIFYRRIIPKIIIEKWRMFVIAKPNGLVLVLVCFDEFLGCDTIPSANNLKVNIFKSEWDTNCGNLTSSCGAKCCLKWQRPMHASICNIIYQRLSDLILDGLAQHWWPHPEWPCPELAASYQIWNEGDIHKSPKKKKEKRPGDQNIGSFGRDRSSEFRTLWVLEA